MKEIKTINDLIDKLEMLKFFNRIWSHELKQNEIIESTNIILDTTINLLKIKFDGNDSILLTYKGKCCSYENLPLNPTIGDVWSIENSCVVWNGNEWKIRKSKY